MTKQKIKEADVPTPKKGEILLYQGQDGKTQVEVSLKDETIWLDAHQMAELFKRDRTVIVRHIHNIYKTRELDQATTCAKNAQVAKDGKIRQMNSYNLDMIISVGYRVNSIRGTQFRIWATNVLRQHLVEGYTLNQKRLQAQSEKLQELQRAIRTIDQIADHKALASDEASALIRVIRDYAYGLDLIDAYDHQRISVAEVSEQAGVPIDYKAAHRAIEELRRLYKAGDLFGREKDDSFQGSLANIFQTYDKQQLYPSIEEKAANLLYFLVRNHPFIDGNKRIAAFMFLWFLEKNKALYRPDRSKRIADNALVALTLMVAESKPKEKDLIVNMTVNLINSKNE
ncbi:MAG: virulence protein RhuM/Fic/DOC family protein [Phycisphaeraceae bacterium]|nr:virulence protein RhuM/Fic/DOC family protein [Phycisphaeraceae bacterium]